MSCGVDAVEDEDETLAAMTQFKPMVQAALTRLPLDGLDLKEYIESIEISLIRQALDSCFGVVAHAAKLLHTRRTTLVEKLRKYGLHRDLVEREQLKA